MRGRVENKKLEIDDQKINEYRELLLQSGLSEKSVHRYIEEIEGFIFLYGDDLSDENIEENANNTSSNNIRQIRRHAVGMFKDWILYGDKPAKSKHYKGDEARKAPAREIPTGCRYWDNMYNKPAFYKDSHSAQWC